MPTRELQVSASEDQDQKDEACQHDAGNGKMQMVMKANCSALTYRNLVLLDCICKLQGLRLAHLACIRIPPHLCQTPVVCSTQHIILSHSGEEGLPATVSQVEVCSPWAMSTIRTLVRSLQACPQAAPGVTRRSLCSVTLYMTSCSACEPDHILHSTYCNVASACTCNSLPCSFQKKKLKGKDWLLQAGNTGIVRCINVVESACK